MMDSELEQILARDLDDVASRLVVPAMPTLPSSPPGGWSRRHRAAPLLLAAAVLATALATVATILSLTGPASDGPVAPPTPAPSAEGAPISGAAPDVPVVVAGTLLVGGEQVPGRWFGVQGTGTRWVGQRDDGSWWWGFDTEPQRMDGAMEQPPVVSPSGGYTARVVSDAGSAMLIGADTEFGGEGFGGVDVPVDPQGPPPRAAAVTDDGLVVAGGPGFQLLWRPLVDNETVDLAETAPGQVVLDGTAAGLVVNEGEYGATDGTQGEPYLARLSEDGALERLGSVPTHDVLEASEQWLAFVPAGTVGGEASAAPDLRVQRLDGSSAGTLTPPEGWLFVAPGFRWESEDSLIGLVVTQDGGDEGLVRCRPEPAACRLLDLP